METETYKVRRKIFTLTLTEDELEKIIYALAFSDNYEDLPETKLRQSLKKALNENIMGG